MRTVYHDCYGFLHHQPASSAGALTSENGPLYTGTELCLKFLTNKARPRDCEAFFEKLKRLYDGKGWRVTPVSDRHDFSKDNWFGVWAAVLFIKKNYREIYEDYSWLVNEMPLFHKQLLHPISFFIVLKAKYGVTMFDWAIQKDFKRTGLQTHKVRNNNHIAKTDGKIMAFILSHAFDWGDYIGKVVRDRKRLYPLPVNNKGVEKGIVSRVKYWKWRSWFNVFYDYFPHKDHPNVVLIQEYERYHTLH